MLVVGGLDLGRRELAMDAASKQAQEGTIVVYVVTNGKEEEVSKELKARGALENSIIVAVDPSQGVIEPCECVAAAAAGTSIADYWTRKGRDTLVVVDDLEEHKKFWDQTERTILEEVGLESVASSSSALAAANSEMRAFYSSLFQRVGYLNQQAGGGSLSMLLLLDRPRIGSGDKARKFAVSDFDPSLYGGKVPHALESAAI
eukprot:751321-Hanusia_phi.AAC.3